MKNYKLLSILVLTVFLSGPIIQSARKTPVSPGDEATPALKIVLPHAERFSDKTGDPPHYTAFRTNPYTGKSEPAGVAFLTSDVAPEIKGYGGPLDILVGITPEGAITNIHLLAHNETLSYLPGLETFLDQFRAKDIHSPLQLGEDIDGISGATITSTAITQAVAKGLKVVTGATGDLDLKKSPAAEQSLPWDQVIVPVLLFALALSGVMTHHQVLRWTALLGGLLYLGIMKSTLLSVVQLANIGLLKFPGFTQSPLWYTLIGLTLFCAILWGLVFCGSLCPFAAIQELLYRLAKRLKIPCLTPLPRIDQRARYLKYGVLLAALVMSYALGHTQATGIEPYLTLFTGHGTRVAWTLVALMMIAACVNFRFWCKYLCPVGACLGLLARVSPFRIHLKNYCTGCQSCAKVCPTDAITINEKNIPVIDHPECILCGNCIRECRKNALTLRATHDEKRQ